MSNCQRKQADADTTSDAMIADLKTNIGALQGQVEALGTELAATQEQRDQYRKKYKEERNKHSALLTTLTELQSDREQLKARIAVLEAENATQAAEIQQCQASLDSAHRGAWWLHRRVGELSERERSAADRTGPDARGTEHGFSQAYRSEQGAR